ncbi:hypothetical protein ACFIN9_20785 [Streptomyces noursei]|uniref:hypothetical protein n=1 Tax=Streptomyces noursei TaxID=1971 RepID=UPI0036D40B5E
MEDGQGHYVANELQRQVIQDALAREHPLDGLGRPITDPGVGTSDLLRAAFADINKRFEDFVASRESDCIVIDAEVRHFRTRKRLWRAAFSLRLAETTAQRRHAAREYLAALADLVNQLLWFLAGVLLRLLSRALGCMRAADIPVWHPEPIEESPQITPRGPNCALPVNTYWGGRHRSALGSAVLAA